MRLSYIRMALAAFAVLAIAAVVAMPASAAEEIHEGEPKPGESGSLYGGNNTNCFWYYSVGGTQEPEPLYNIAYPDGHALYSVAYFRRPVGSKLVIHGTYPHARYMSWISYNAGAAIIDGNYDAMLKPDAGSVNPFQAGQPRTGTNHYTLEVSEKTNPSSLPINHFEGEPYNLNPETGNNIIYAGAPGPLGHETLEGKEYQTEILIQRVYATDKGANNLGNVPLPEVELTLAGGEKVTGLENVCHATDSKSESRLEKGLSYRIPEPAALLLNEHIWHAMSKPEVLEGFPGLTNPGCNVNFKPATPKNECPTWNGKNPVSVASELIQVPRAVEYPEEFPAKPTEYWRDNFNRKYLLQAWTGDNAPGAEAHPTKISGGGGGFFPNDDNNYEIDWINRHFGQEVVVHGKLPTTPETYEGATTWPAGEEPQMRYWSMCSQQSLRSTEVTGCAYDSEVPVNAERKYTIVASDPEEKPTNAVRFCGVAWVDWSEAGDGEKGAARNRAFGMLFMRNMLPNKSFTHAAQDITKAGTDKEVMGEYLPTTEYQPNKAAFESSQGCSWANPGTPQLKAGSSTPNTGGFALEWAPSREAAKVSGVTYTLQAKNANGSWETVASGLTSPEYTFSSAPEGTWTYRVQAQGEGAESEYTGGSAEVKVDRSAPNTPSANPAGSPAYGSWYKDSVEVTFTANGDVALPDGSEGSGVDPASLSSPQTFSTSGSHIACGTVADVLGNLSAQGCTAVQVDATPPSVQVTCPATAILRSSGITATVTASDGESGLAQNPAGIVPVSTSSLGAKTTTETAIDNVGHETSSSCTTDVVYAFSGLKPPAGKKIKAGKAVAVGFNLKDALGYVTVGSGTLEVAPVTGGVVGSYKPATSTVNTGDQFQAAKGGKYTYSLATASLGKGTFSLRVTVSDGTVHTTSITLK